MKKATLLLAMIFFIVGVLLLRNADADTILIKQQTGDLAMEPLLQATEETVRTKTEIEQEAVSEPKTDFPLEDSVQAGGGDSDTTTVGNVAFFRLLPDEQMVYSEILNSLLTRETETTLSTKDTSLIDRAFRCVMLDHPEIFYVDGYKYTEYTSDNVIEKIVFSGKYIYDNKQIQEKQALIDAAVEQILADVPDTEDEYEKVKYIYESVISRTEYDTEAKDNQNICSVLINGRSVCQGYAKATQYLLHKLEIEAGLVTGTVRRGDGHAWNLVSVNGDWYYLDATWGDAYYLLGGESQDVPITGAACVNYDYLCVTTEQIEQSHVINMPVTVPECTSMKENYYVKEGLYFEQYEEERICNLFRQAIEAGDETVTIKCSDDIVYDRIWNELIEQQKIFQFMQTGNGTIAYTDNPEQGSITFWL